MFVIPLFKEWRTGSEIIVVINGPFGKVVVKVIPLLVVVFVVVIGVIIQNGITVVLPHVGANIHFLDFAYALLAVLDGVDLIELVI